MRIYLTCIEKNRDAQCVCVCVCRYRRDEYITTTTKNLTGKPAHTANELNKRR